jgi:ParB-like chromosome segregation protein Spo0J
LAASLREIGQIVPLVVEMQGAVPVLVDGRRRLEAAQLLDSDEHPFKLDCVVRTNGGDPLQTAIHANLKRRGYTPLQFAKLCAELRKSHKWEGTAEVAQYLGVSRAQVSQHDKLLSKPTGMDKATYESLLAKVGSGLMGADAAFYALTHVEPEKAAEVLQRAEELAGGTQTTADAETIAPAGANARQTIKGKAADLQKAARIAAGTQSAAKPPEWMKEQREKHKARLATAKVEKKHVKQAAKEAKAVKRDLQKTLPELRAMFTTLKSSAYPDVMRSFITLLADAWWRGDASDKDVIVHWGQIAQLVEDALKRTRTAKGAKRAGAKAGGAKAKAKK